MEAAKPKTTIVKITRDTLDEAVEILANSFLSMNDIWKGFNPKREEIVPFLKFRLGLSVDVDLAYCLEVDGKMAGVTVQYDAVDYLNMPPFETQCQLFLALGQYAKELEGAIAEGGYTRGQCVIGAYGVIDPIYASKGYTVDFWYEGFKFLAQLGFKTYYSRASHPISLAILKKFGGQEVNSLEFREEALKGNKLTLVRIDLTKELPPLDSLRSKKKDAAKAVAEQPKPQNPPAQQQPQ